MMEARRIITILVVLAIGAGIAYGVVTWHAERVRDSWNLPSEQPSTPVPPTEQKNIEPDLPKVGEKFGDLTLSRVDSIEGSGEYVAYYTGTTSVSGTLVYRDGITGGWTFEVVAEDAHKIPRSNEEPRSVWFEIRNSEILKKYAKDKVYSATVRIRSYEEFERMTEGGDKADVVEILSVREIPVSEAEVAPKVEALDEVPVTEQTENVSFPAFGTKVGDFTFSSSSILRDGFKAVYTGTTTVSGSLWFNEMFSAWCFTVENKDDVHKIPRIGVDMRGPSFCFNNGQQTFEKFSIATVYRQTVVINGYNETYRDTEIFDDTPDTTSLVRVLSSTEYVSGE